MRRFLRKDILALEEPHQKSQLSTRIGRVVERASYTDIALCTAFALALTSAYFAFGVQGHTLLKSGDAYDVGYVEALYFSIVTFTSLGYGDLSPIGFGRLVASALVFWGLATIALLIGKIASERSQTSLLLLHGSDVERRISAFVESFSALTHDGLELQKKGDFCGLGVLVRAMVDGHQSMNKYLVFHANQSTALASGNESSLSALLKELAGEQEFCISLYKEATEMRAKSIARSTVALAYRLHWTANFLGEQYDEAASMNSWSRTLGAKLSRKQTPKRPFSKSTSSVVSRMESNLDALEKFRSTSITIDTLDEIYDLMPDGPTASWPRHIHKEIAKKINTSNSRVSRHIDQLIDEGALPK